MQRSVSRFKTRPLPKFIGIKQEPRWRRENLIPTPPCDIVLRDVQISRLSEHYYTTLKEDLMYLTYNHQFHTDPPPKERNIRLRFDPENPYTKGRKNLPVGGTTHTGIIRKPPPPSTATNTISLQAIHLHIFVKSAIGNKSNITPQMMVLRMLSGANKEGGGHHTARGVEVVKGKKTEAGWIRPGMPCGVKVELKGEAMWTFLSTLTTFVLPRLKDFPGFPLPLPSANIYSPSQASGVVSFGFGPNALALFPQIEVNADSYPKLEGLHIHCVTDARGVGAQMKARQLLSGYQIPFYRR